MRPYRRRSSWFVNFLWIAILVWAARSCSDRKEPSSEDASEDRTAAIEQKLGPAAEASAKEGIAALVLMDVSGSMADPVGNGGRPKIEIAREAALVLVRQFDGYAKSHPDEQVLVGLLEFSERPPSSARQVIPLSTPDPVRAQEALLRMQAGGGTPIGDAMVAGKLALDRSGLSRRHLLVVTDGENTDGDEPADVMKALSHRPEAERPSVYFVAFDVEASRFSGVRDAGALVLPAANANELNQTIDALLTGKILVENP